MQYIFILFIISFLGVVLSVCVHLVADIFYLIKLCIYYICVNTHDKRINDNNSSLVIFKENFVIIIHVYRLGWFHV